MVFLAGVPTTRYSAGRIARTLCVSEAHLAKVLQRLSKTGFLVSVRGPNGGFRSFEPDECLMHDHSCGQMGCLFGDLLGDINRQVREYLGSRNLEDVKWVYASAGDRKGNPDEA
jgi:DNA-binding IscR family transcriptional regulator